MSHSIEWWDERQKPWCRSKIFRFSAGCQTYWIQLLTDPKRHTAHSLTHSINWHTKESSSICAQTTFKRWCLWRYSDTHWTLTRSSSFALEFHKTTCMHDTPKPFQLQFFLSFFSFVCLLDTLLVRRSVWFDCNFIDVEFATVVQITTSKSRRLHSIDSKWLVDILQSIKFE